MFFRSEVLENLLFIGVKLPMVEKDEKAANFLLTCDYMRDIHPYLVFLYEVVQ